MSKLIGGIVAVILVVGAAVGVVVVMNHHNSSSSSKAPDDNAALSSTTKAVAAVCTPTDYKKACVDSMSSLAHNNSATPKDFLHAAIDIVTQAVKKAMEKPESFIGSAADDKANKERLEDCKDLLQYAVDELQASYSMVGDNDLHTIKQREGELLNWLSAVVSFQETCVDRFEDAPKQREAMSLGLLNATQLTANALSIVGAISDIVKAFNIPDLKDLNKAAAAATERKLLETDEAGYPQWMSAADRKLLASNGPVKPNAVVAKDGSGQYKTIADALASYPKGFKGRYVIYVKAGVYDEYITVTKDQTNVFMYGDGPRKTLVTGKKSHNSGYDTFRTATFSAVGQGFIAKSMGFQNTAGPLGEQAVALRSQSDMSAFYNVRIDGYQDSLYTQTNKQFYRNCVISGTVDFIFGDASVLIQNCLIICRLPRNEQGHRQKNIVTAQGRKLRQEATGIVIQNCRIVPEQKLFPIRFEIESYLGRPWKEYSRTIIMESTLGDFIRPEGWLPWEGNFALDTLFYAEYGNRGPGANTANRVKWKGYKGVIDRNQAMQFTAGPFILGNVWLRGTGAPFFLGLKH